MTSPNGKDENWGNKHNKILTVAHKCLGEKKKRGGTTVEGGSWHLFNKGLKPTGLRKNWGGEGKGKGGGEEGGLQGRGLNTGMKNGTPIKVLTPDGSRSRRGLRGGGRW